MTKKILFLFVLGFLVMPVVVVYGQGCGEVGQPPCSSVGSIRSLGEVGKGTVESGYITVDDFVSTLISIVNWLSWFVGLAAVVMGLYSGFLFITARDDTNQLATARKIMLYAIIGIAVAIVSFSLVTITKAFIWGT